MKRYFKILVKKIILFLLLLVGVAAIAQKQYTVKGNFPQAKNIELKLEGFEAFKDTLLSGAKTDDQGNFVLTYPAAYKGAALLKIKEGGSVIVLLNQENFTINWGDFKDFNTLQFTNSPENENFGKGIVIAQEAENILAGLKYLKPMYAKSPVELQWLDKEIVIKENAFTDFSKKLPASSYAVYYLTIRKLIQDMPLTANRYIERMPDHEKQFAAINFSDPRLVHSGLLKELIDGFYLLMESYGDQDKVAEHTKPATEALLKSLENNTKLKQEIAEYLFKLLEKRSLFIPAEQVAMYMLNDKSCSLTENKTALYEQYRKMKVGNKTVEINLNSNTKGISKLSDINAKYKLIVFGSSWCPRCQEELPALKDKYKQWKDKYDLEIVFISLDTDQLKYQAFVKDFPFISSCDFKEWKTQSAIDYCVFATPTMYLLDNQNTILLKPLSAGHLDSWLSSVVRVN